MSEPLSAKTNRKKIKYVVNAGVIAALYVVLTLPFAQFAYGPVQFRLAELLTVLPTFSPAAIPGVAIGCFLANLFNPSSLGPVDVIFGTLATVLAAFVSRLLGRKSEFLGLIPPIVFNGLIVGGYLPFLLADSASSVTVAVVLISMGEVAASEAVLLGVLGIPMVLLIKKTRIKEYL